LTDSLKNMVSVLLSHENELKEMNKTLEKKVQERTVELQDANEKLTHLSRHDTLTQLHNRLASNEYLHQEFLRMKRTHTPFSVAVLDIDHFKKVNDTYGHDVGDVVLIHVAKILKELARTTDFVARFGGEEFLLILPDTLQEGAYKVAEKIRSAIETSNPPTVKNITLSIGIATASEEDKHEDYVVKMADKALYQAKNEGRNRVVCSVQ
ncbi:MAG: GGDEF domain-containing protein, partial [Sulfurospirillaceae bacterium]|nr:GGDEF domain-containing protein [Sulfurospirillaceae bacterium]